MGCDNKHGVGIMLNKRWRKRIIDTEYINERAIKTTILVNRQHIDLMSVYFPPLEICGSPQNEKMYKTIEKHMPNNKKCIPIIGRDINAELGPGKGTECKSVGMYTLNESNKRGDWFEKLVDVKRLLRAQHDVQENTTKTYVLLLSKKEKRSKLTTS